MSADNRKINQQYETHHHNQITTSQRNPLKNNNNWNIIYMCGHTHYGNSLNRPHLRKSVNNNNKKKIKDHILILPIPSLTPQQLLTLTLNSFYPEIKKKEDSNKNAIYISNFLQQYILYRIICVCVIYWSQ